MVLGYTPESHTGLATVQREDTLLLLRPARNKGELVGDDLGKCWPQRRSSRVRFPAPHDASWVPVQSPEETSCQLRSQN